MALIAAIHEQAAPKMKSIDNASASGLVVSKDKKIVSSLTGTISKDMNMVFQNYGLGYSG